MGASDDAPSMPLRALATASAPVSEGRRVSPATRLTRARACAPPSGAATVAAAAAAPAPATTTSIATTATTTVSSPVTSPRHVCEPSSAASPPVAQPGPDATMPPSVKPAYLLPADGSRSHHASPYGSVAPARRAGADSDSELDDGVHQLRRVHDSVRSRRSLSSKRSFLSRHSSRRSDDLDGAAALVSGLEGRFGLAEAPLLPGDIGLDHDGAASDDASEPGLRLDDDQSSTESDDGSLRNSPHEAVRASVPPTDDTTLSINTPRMWCLSVLFSILGSSTNLFFSLRYPSVAITPVIALLLVHPLGHLWDMVLKRPGDPRDDFVDGVRTRPGHDSPGKLASWRLWLAQGRWNQKEHTCVYVSSNVAFGFGFATDVIVEQTRFYNQEAPVVYQLLLTMSTQILGYGFAGMARRLLVRPSAMIWPGTLMSAAMFSTLHNQDNKPANGWTISRWNFFYVVWAVSFAFYFLPGLLFPALSYFNVVTWFAPRNVVVANLFGVVSGLGLFPVTFDWAQITYVGSPLLVPFWAAMNVIGGLVVVMWIIAPVLYYSNVLYSSYMPILSAGVFDNTGSIYNVTRILTPDFLFDRDAYATYSRVFLPITYVLSYGVQFAGLAALLTHTLCWHGQDIWRTMSRSLREARRDAKPIYQPVGESRTASSASLGSGDDSWADDDDDMLSREDVHCRLMNRYKDAPLSWYLLTFASMAAMGMFVVE